MTLVCYCDLLRVLVSVLVIPSCRYFIVEPWVGIRDTESRPWWPSLDVVSIDVWWEVGDAHRAIHVLDIAPGSEHLILWSTFNTHMWFFCVRMVVIYVYVPRLYFWLSDCAALVDTSPTYWTHRYGMLACSRYLFYFQDYMVFWLYSLVVYCRAIYSCIYDYQCMSCDFKLVLARLCLILHLSACK